MTRLPGRVVASAAEVLVVGIWDTVLLIVLPSLLALGDVTFVVAVVDARTKILLVEVEAEVVLIDLLSIVAG